jgi:propionyl-CoA carboxylase alpha chain
MFRKILIANRGEIACRIARTARRMGIATVAVHSDADEGALHVKSCDEAVRIGPAASSESYLRGERIIEAARAMGAEAIHPGYGFLSENAAFAASCAEAGIVFIGPDARAIAALGDKVEAKKLAAAAGVSTVPGRNEAMPSPEAALEAAQALGYPVMVKAAAGGGGKGMRMARSDAELAEGFRLAASEARSSFGDARLFIEKYIEEPRHIEIQVLADAHGNIVHLFERECSIQRRHQKVIEEAPSPFLDEATRAAMGAQAVALARATRYRSAGTVEFVVDRRRRFYFLEANTRLQVEHPVTESVTGLDLVEWMIRIAAGEPLPFTQDSLRLEGAAIEARIYAEDPFRNFLPSTGRLVRYLPPQDPGLRIDTGVFEGAEIGIHYDPMIAKLIANGRTREEAMERLSDALDEFHIAGVSHNIPFLAAVVGGERFRAGALSTSFIDDEFPLGFTGAALSAKDEAEALAAAAAARYIAAEAEARIEGQMRPVAAPADWTICRGEERHDAHVARAGAALAVTVDFRSMSVATDWQPWLPVLRAAIDGHRVAFQIAREGIGLRLSRAGWSYSVKVLPPRAAELFALMPERAEADLSHLLLSPMPGLLVSIAVAEGQEVKAGEELAVVEAMKMENVLRAERDARVKKLHVKPGDNLAADQIILEFA